MVINDELIEISVKATFFVNIQTAINLIGNHWVGLEHDRTAIVSEKEVAVSDWHLNMTPPLTKNENRVLSSTTQTRHVFISEMRRIGVVLVSSSLPSFRYEWFPFLLRLQATYLRYPNTQRTTVFCPVALLFNSQTN